MLECDGEGRWQEEVLPAAAWPCRQWASRLPVRRAKGVAEVAEVAEVGGKSHRHSGRISSEPSLGRLLKQATQAGAHRIGNS